MVEATLVSLLESAFKCFGSAKLVLVGFCLRTKYVGNSCFCPLTPLRLWSSSLPGLIYKIMCLILWTFLVWDSRTHFYRWVLTGATWLVLYHASSHNASSHSANNNAVRILGLLVHLLHHGHGRSEMLLEFKQRRPSHQPLHKFWKKRPRPKELYPL